MHKAAGLLVALLVLLAGCNAPSIGSSPTPTPTETATPTEAPTTQSDTTTSGDSDFDFSDPESDRLGWEGGYWHNETLDVNNLDGLDEDEQDAVINRAMARIEYVRQKEFQDRPPVEVITRQEFRDRTVPEYTDQFRTFDNVKFEGMFFVGEDEDSLVVQNQNRGSSVLGFFSPRNDTIVVISDTGEVQFDGEGTLAHELVHALQDQYFNLTSIHAATRDGHNAQNGIIEGEANFVQRRYTSRCGGEWECIDSPEGGGAPGDLHFGIYFMSFFPYNDGPQLVGELYRRGGWDAVDDAYADLPTSSEQVLYPDRYIEDRDEPTRVRLRDTNSGGWERLRPDPPRPNQHRAEYATLGQSAITSMFTYTAYDRFNRTSLLGQRDFLNVNEQGNVNSTYPINYDVGVSAGWDGDRMHVYTNPNAGANETAYVWRIVWDSEADAREFANGYRALLSHWGGERVSGNTWHIPEGDSPFADAFYIEVNGDTVTIVNAPTTDDLGDVYAGYPG